jgi:hypothetical protein
MESRLIYSILNSGNLTIEWKNNSDKEWIYVGTDKEIKCESIANHIEEEFNEDTFYIALERTTSKELNKSEIETEVITRIGKEDFIISNLTFDKFIEFNKIGVMRIGRKKKTTANKV